MRWTAHLGIIEKEGVVSTLLEQLQTIQFLHYNLSTIGPSLKANLHLLLVALPRFEPHCFLEHSLLLWHKLDLHSGSGVLLEVNGGGGD